MKIIGQFCLFLIISLNKQKKNKFSQSSASTAASNSSGTLNKIQHFYFISNLHHNKMRNDFFLEEK